VSRKPEAIVTVEMADATMTFRVYEFDQCLLPVLEHDPPSGPHKARTRVSDGTFVLSGKTLRGPRAASVELINNPRCMKEWMKRQGG